MSHRVAQLIFMSTAHIIVSYYINIRRTLVTIYGSEAYGGVPIKFYKYSRTRK